MPPRLTPALALAAVLALTLASCADDPAPTETPIGTPLPSQSVETAAPVTLDPDIALYIGTTLTDPSGAVVDLTLRVHTSTAWDDEDPSAAIRPEFIAGACAPGYDTKAFEEQSWSFALVDISATTRDGATWPTGLAIPVLPAPGELPIAAGGIVISDPTAAGDFCGSGKVVSGAGDGTIVIGFSDDAALTAWAGQSYGFTASTGSALSNCTYVVTGTGTQTSGGAAFAPAATTGECRVAP